MNQNRSGATVKILRADEVSDSPLYQDWREAAWGSLAGGLLLLVVAVGFAGFPFVTGEWDEPLLMLFCLPIALLFGAFARASLRLFVHSLKAEGWLMRWSSGGIYFRYRSPLNHRFPADTPTVLFLLSREIAVMRPFSHVFNAPDDQGDWVQWHRRKGLEFELRDLDLEPLRRALAAEHNRRGPRGGRWEHRPVTLTREGRLRVMLGRPRAALEALSRCYRVDQQEVKTVTSADRATAHKQEEAIIALVEAGETVAAIKAVRLRYGCDLAEARRMVEELVAG